MIFVLFRSTTVTDTQWRSWLRHCATSRKVAGSIPDGVIGIFHWHNPSGRTMALGVDSASNRNEYQECFLGVKAAGTYGWQPYHLHVPTVLKSGSVSLLKPLRPVQACNGIALLFFLVLSLKISQFIPEHAAFFGSKISKLLVFSLYLVPIIHRILRRRGARSG